MLPVNPRGDRLGQENAVLSGSGTRYYVPDFEGCLSIKSVVNGNAVWECENRRFSLKEDCWLIVNDRQRYTITIDSYNPVTTFCLFFERGFVEDIQGVHVTATERLLDCPQAGGEQKLEFCNCIEGEGRIGSLLTRFRTELMNPAMSRNRWDQIFVDAGETLVCERGAARQAMARLSSVRPSTREEVYRRLLRGRDFAISSLSEPIRLKDMAAAACLSPFHFHRAFRRAFGETPHGFLTRQRLRRAEGLLRERKWSVTEVCLSTGFESPASFSHLFKRNHGVSPSEFSKIQQAR